MSKPVPVFSKWADAIYPVVGCLLILLSPVLLAIIVGMAVRGYRWVVAL